jgi:acetyltransferase-like isoleucine patch superfamily enzyme
MIGRIFSKITQELRKAKLKSVGVSFEENISFDSDTYFEGGNRLFGNGRFYRSYIGYGTYIQRNALIYYTKIGRFCSIGSGFQSVVGRHPTRNFISTHPAFFSLGKQSGFTFVKFNKFNERKKIDGDYSIEIGNDVFIGVDVIVLGGVKIGDGAVIGAGSVIHKDVEPYSICVGSPQKLITYRFPPEDIEFLLKIQWWNKPVDWIRKNADAFENLDKFKDLPDLKIKC